MLPTHLVHTENKNYHHLANLCFGGADGKTLFITESLSGDILTARMPVAGKKMFGLS
jgi:gluconolactonase